MDKVELALGMTVFYRGREYVIAGFQERETHDGRSMTLDCLEPLYAQRNKMDQEARRSHAEQALKLMPKMEKIADKALDDGDL